MNEAEAIIQKHTSFEDQAKQIFGRLSYDLPNFVDPNEIDDTHERFKYMFPFYRMDIMMLDVKLNALALSDLPSHVKDTGYLSLDHIMQGFCTSPAWVDQWPNLEALLTTSAFKEFVNDDVFKQHVTDPEE